MTLVAEAVLVPVTVTYSVFPPVSLDETTYSNSTTNISTLCKLFHKYSFVYFSIIQVNPGFDLRYFIRLLLLCRLHVSPSSAVRGGNRHLWAKKAESLHYNGFGDVLNNSNPAYNAKSTKKNFQKNYFRSNCETWVNRTRATKVTAR